MKFSFSLALFTLFLTGCAYQLGNIPGKEVEGISSINVPVVRNETYEPGISVMVTDAIIQRFHSDGTMTVTREANADATLEVKLTRFERSPLRSVRNDTRTVAEYRVFLLAEIVLRKNDGTVLIKEKVAGDTEFFIGNDLQEGERQAMGLVADELANNIVLRVTEGW
ncbi:MAG: LPS assembly lipoprotein LptE [Verrucomicrobiia bacterium]